MPGVDGGRPPAPWHQPEPLVVSPKLTLFNSLTRRKDEFVPRNGRRVSWYICGPTVYDSTHIGHARNYLAADIVRRVLQSYFGYDVQYVMNVTDIDDKIIKRARQRHLLEEYYKERSEAPVRQVIDDVMAALQPFNVRFENEANADKKVMLQRLVERVDVAVASLESALLGQGDVEAAKADVLKQAADVLADWLDGLKGASIGDMSIFSKLARIFENEFHDDMALLGILPPDVLTRVSEYVPEIVAYIQKIIDNGFAYATDSGSVYFDSVAFDKCPQHYYAKLVPFAFTDGAQLKEAMREGEGELSISDERLQEKHNATDFALWKAWKAGEPRWPSPWGDGRPGWHIECSVMASEICGDHLDIHSGGYDLRFPHNDNEIAQAEAYFGHSNWVNYFLHTGTLRIEGLKMSKSLKNLITIRQALEMYTPRQLRLLFLLQRWTDNIDFGKEPMERALQFEKLSQEFFLAVKSYCRETSTDEPSNGYEKFGKAELQLDAELTRAADAVHAALCDNVDTAAAMEALRELIGRGNAYLAAVERSADGRPNALLLRKVAGYMTWLWRVFGVVPSDTSIGFPDAATTSGATEDREQTVMPYLTALSDFRERVRTVAVREKVTEILTVCDDLRDNVLIDLGVRLEDRVANRPPRIKLVDRATLLREAEQKRALDAEKQLERERKAAEQAAREAEREAQRRVPPAEMFKGDPKWARFDDCGIPTHSADGEQIGKKQRKKLEKAYEQQQKRYGDVPNGAAS